MDFFELEWLICQYVDWVLLIDVESDGDRLMELAVVGCSGMLLCRCWG